MAEKPTWLAVVAAAIRDPVGRLLLQQALPGKPHAQLWEFPGGKVESEENPRLALAREVGEELSLTLDPDAMYPIGFADQRAVDGSPAIVLFLYTSLRWQGVPEAREGQNWDWFTPEEAARLSMAAMDRALLAVLLTDRSG